MRAIYNKYRKTLTIRAYELTGILSGKYKTAPLNSKEIEEFKPERFADYQQNISNEDIKYLVEHGLLTLKQ